jgi:hypothetical protein
MHQQAATRQLDGGWHKQRLAIRTLYIQLSECIMQQQGCEAMCSFVAIVRRSREAQRALICNTVHVTVVYLLDRPSMLGCSAGVGGLNTTFRRTIAMLKKSSRP